MGMAVSHPTVANGIFFGIQPFVQPSILATTSADTLYVNSYLVDRIVDTPWRSTSTSLQNIDLDLGSPIVNPVVVIMGLNCKNVTLILDDESTFTAPPVSTALEVFKDIRTGMRKGFSLLTGTYRYLRVQIPGSQTTDGSVGYYQLGEIFVLPYAQLRILDARHQLPIDAVRYRPSYPVEYAQNSGRSAVNIGRRRVRFELSSVGFYINDIEKLYDISYMDNDQQFLFFENLRVPVTETRAVDSSRVYAVKHIGEFTIVEEHDILTTGWVLEEQ